MLADPGPSLLGSTVVAALVSAAVALATLSWNSRRDTKDRQRKLFAEAFEACVLYREYPFIVRRRAAGNLAADRARIFGELNQLQARLNSYMAILRVEAPRVGATYSTLVAATRRVAGAEIHASWDMPPLAADGDVHIEGGIDYAALLPVDDAYLNEVRDHLSLMPRWLLASLRTRTQ